MRSPQIEGVNIVNNELLITNDASVSMCNPQIEEDVIVNNEHLLSDDITTVNIMWNPQNENTVNDELLLSEDMIIEVMTSEFSLDQNQDNIVADSINERQDLNITEVENRAQEEDENVPVIGQPPSSSPYNDLLDRNDHTEGNSPDTEGNSNSSAEERCNNREVRKKMTIRKQHSVDEKN